MNKVITQDPNDTKFLEWVFYDGQCQLCVKSIHKVVNILNTRNVGLTPVQTSWVQKHTKHIEDPLKEILVQTSDGNILGGGDAVIYLSQKIWWAYGIFILALIPGMRGIIRYLYAQVAKNRHCVHGRCDFHINS